MAGERDDVEGGERDPRRRLRAVDAADDGAPPAPPAVDPDHPAARPSLSAVPELDD